MLWNILLILILFLPLTSLLGFYSSIKPPKIVSDITPKDLEFDYEKVSFITSDGIKLIGWWLPNKNPAAKTLVLLHGYPADKGDILPALAFLNKRYNLLLFDFRYLGQSEGRYSTAGAKETADLTAAIQYLKTRGINEIGVWGFYGRSGSAYDRKAGTGNQSNYFRIKLCLARFDGLELYRIRF